MQLNKTSLLGVGISNNSKNELLQEVQTHLTSSKNKLLTIVTPNPEQVVLAQKDVQFREILNAADIALPDGVGITWALKSKVVRIPGIEFMEYLVELAAKKSWNVGFIGARNGIAQTALTKLQEKYKGLTGWAQDGPEVEIKSSRFDARRAEFRILNSDENEYFKKLIEKINNNSTRMIFVGLGAPKQEYFIQKLTHNLQLATYNSLILMSVGGVFDELSGNIPRPPQFISDIGLKWLWRLIVEPWRIKRQLNLLKFIQLIFRS